jgi:transposase
VTKERKPRTRREFTSEFKQEAVRLMQERKSMGASLAQVSRELEIEPDLLREWARKLGQWDEPGVERVGWEENGTPRDPEAELRKLKREYEILRQERDFLKKATAFFAKESQ